MQVFDLATLWFILLGLLGGFTFIVVNSEKFEELIAFYAFKRYLIGAIVGFLYRILYSEHSFPNSIMCFVAGYMGTTFIQGLIDRFKRE